VLLAWFGPGPAALGSPAVLSDDLEEMRTLQRQVRAASAKAIAATVHVRIVSPRFMSQGSGVIVSEDGLVLTAAHVVGDSGRRCTLTLHDGREVQGRSLGLNMHLDCGMIRIEGTDEKFDHVELGDERELEQGDWCIALGHPNGYVKGRAPVVRLGRLQPAGWMAPFLRTDCAIISGDSGGPLINLAGEVIGIHSRIQARVSSNYHVGGSTFAAQWARMLAGRNDEQGTARLGVRGEDASPGARLNTVVAGSAADQAGLEAGDVILRFKDRQLRGWKDLVRQISEHAPGDEIELVVQRGRERLMVDVILGARE